MGVAVATIDGSVSGAGDYQHAFSIQSISKVFGLVMAMERLGDSLWQRVNMEPSGQPFNYCPARVGERHTKKPCH